MTVDEKRYTLRDCASIFKRGLKTMYRWKDEGVFKRVIELPSGGYLIPESEVRRLLKERPPDEFDA